MPRKKRVNLSKLIGLLIFLTLTFYVGITLYQQQQEMIYLRELEKNYLQEIEKIQEEIEVLNQQLQTSDNDQYIEKIARQQLKMIRSDEIMVIDIGNLKNQ